MLDALARFVLRRRRFVLVATAVLVAAMAVLATGAFSVLKSGGFDNPASDSSRAAVVMDRDFGGQANLLLLLTPTDGRSLDSPQVAKEAGSITRGLTDRGDVTAVHSYWSDHSAGLRSKDAKSALITLHVDGDEKASKDTSTAIIDRYAKDHPAVDVQAGGELGAGHDLGKQTGIDLSLAEGIAIPLTMILLFFVFGSLLAASLPLIIGLIAMAGTFAELALLGRMTDVSIYAVNLTTALGLGLAIDYSLLMVSRFREEIQRGADVESAVRITMRTAGRTVLFSSATVAVALAAMVVFPLYFLRSFAYAGVGVVLIAMLAALIVLPALLATFGTKVAKGRRKRARNVGAGNVGAGNVGESNFWHRIATGVMRRPVAVAVAVVGLLLFLGTPFLHISFASPDDRVLPTSVNSRQVGDVLRADYRSSAASTIYAVVSGDSSRADIGRYADELRALPNVDAVSGPVDARGASSSYLAISGPTDTSSADSQQLVHDIRAVDAPGEGNVLVGGSTAKLVDSKQAIAAGLPWAIVWITLSTLVLLFLFTGSVVLPLKALLLNVLSLSAVLGAMVWIFQDGHFSGLLGFTPTPLDTSMPILLFCIAFGLSMDYEVFLLSRIKELHDQGADTRTAVAGGLSRTGRIVTTAAALLAITFFAFGTAQTSLLQLFGIGTGIAIVLDATLVRGLLVPAFMRLAGAANWWAPAPLRRLHARFGLSDAEDGDDLSPEPQLAATIR